MLAGFEQPDEGFIRISGEYVQGVPPYKRDVNTVFQHYALFPHMTVAENVAYGLRQKGVRKTEIAGRVAEALDMVKMTKLADRKPKQMSGGQQQRVAVARALVNRPSVLLLDEPLGALDRKLREEMQIELKLLQSQLGITFIFVTHDQEEAMGMSDRIAIMLDGHIEQLADPETVYERPASAFVAGFIGRNNFWRGISTGAGVRASDGTVFVVVHARRARRRRRCRRSPPCGPSASACRAPTPAATTNQVAGTVAERVALRRRAAVRRAHHRARHHRPAAPPEGAAPRARRRRCGAHWSACRRLPVLGRPGRPRAGRAGSGCRRLSRQRHHRHTPSCTSQDPSRTPTDSLVKEHPA